MGLGQWRNYAAICLLAIEAGDSSQTHYRQRYIDGIVTRNGEHANVLYKSSQPAGKFPALNPLMITLFDIKPGGMPENIRTEVYPLAFSRLRTECDFQSALFDHEFYHRRQIIKGVEFDALYSNDMKKLFELGNHDLNRLHTAFIELDAIYNEVKKGRYKNCLSEEWRKRTKYLWDYYYSILNESDHEMPEFLAYLRAEFRKKGLELWQGN